MLHADRNANMLALAYHHSQFFETHTQNKSKFFSSKFFSKTKLANYSVSSTAVCKRFIPFQNKSLIRNILYQVSDKTKI